MIQTNRNIRGWLVVVTSFLIMAIIFATCISCMGVYIKPVCEDLGIERTGFSLAITVSSLAMVVSAVFAGKLMTKYSIRLLMTAGGIMCAASMFIYASAPVIGFFYIAGVLMGTSVSLTCNIPVAILIKSWFPDRQQGLAMGIALVGSGVGSMVLNPIYSYIIAAAGWRWSFGAAGAIILILIVPLIVLVARLNPAVRDKADSSESASDGYDEITLADSLKMPATWAVFFGYIMASLVSMAVLSHGVAYMTDSGISPDRAVGIISVGSGALILGKIVAGHLCDRIGLRKTTILTMTFQLLAFIAFWVSGINSSLLITAVFILFYGLGTPVITVTYPFSVSYMFGSHDYGSILGLFSMTGGIGGILQILISMVYDSTGSYSLAFAGIAAFCALGLIFFVIFLRPQHKR